MNARFLLTVAIPVLMSSCCALPYASRSWSVDENSRQLDQALVDSAAKAARFKIKQGDNHYVRNGNTLKIDQKYRRITLSGQAPAYVFCVGDHFLWKARDEEVAGNLTREFRKRGVHLIPATPRQVGSLLEHL